MLKTGLTAKVSWYKSREFILSFISVHFDQKNAKFHVKNYIIQNCAKFLLFTSFFLLFKEYRLVCGVTGVTQELD